ncbi:hypothetical protein [Myroides odoratus]|uniref:Uncharacterized protein n=1 Tax=Myroides odoratus TaxID=256 RepID=A0A9Q6Z2Q0_MYROD|nr:hypothetical protein [Myroides odoratus]EHQ41587.1 hypothetical protein Myrod_0751 [Myroides odoratus DSM 2801]EKB08794.1 hypothetical protein HMPREF9716_00691 [Myroides odoratus CIP 103059]QQT99002.1 hypothetical protein I6I88_12365 [Myroides odoratus]WQD58807.1 hypothetical protein U0010_06605 [Myroides odoratus]STZ28851.1 Uncharacterised protein [Myroides odoratus]
MKRFFLLSFALVFLSCAKDEPLTNEGSLGNEITTVDNGIGYHSPYNYTKPSYIEQNNISYMFYNNTNLIFQVTPNFAPAYYQYYSTSTAYYTNATEINIAPNDSRIYTSVAAVPTIQVYPWGSDDYFDFPTGPGDLAKRGKLFYIDFTVNNEPNSIGTVKIPFPYNVNSSNGLPYPWRPTGISDNVLNDELIYNYITREVCSTINPERPIKDFFRFTYNDRNYIVKSDISENKVIFTLNYN